MQANERIGQGFAISNAAALTLTQPTVVHRLLVATSTSGTLTIVGQNGVTILSAMVLAAGDVVELGLWLPTGGTITLGGTCTGMIVYNGG